MTRAAWLLMLLLAALWGASYLFIKIALDGGMSETFIVFARTLLGAAVLAPVLLRRDVLGPVRRNLGWLAFIALVQVVAPFLLITAGEHHVPTSLAGILVASTPIFTAIIAAVAVHDDRLSGWGAVGIVAGIAGVAMLFGVDLHGDADAVLGGLGMVLAALGYAVGAIVAKTKLAGVPPVGVAGSIVALAALFMLPTVPFGAPSSAPDLGVVAALVVLGAGGTGVAFVLFYMLIADVGPSRAAVVAYIAPGFAVLYGVTLLDEPFTVGTAVGLVLILAGSWLAASGTLPGRRRAPRDADATASPSRSTAPAPGPVR